MVASYNEEWDLFLKLEEKLTEFHSTHVGKEAILAEISRVLGSTRKKRIALVDKFQALKFDMKVRGAQVISVGGGHQKTCIYER